MSTPMASFDSKSMLMVSASDVRGSFLLGFLERQAPRDFNALSVLGRVPLFFARCDDGIKHYDVGG